MFKVDKYALQLTRVRENLQVWRELMSVYMRVDESVSEIFAYASAKQCTSLRDG